MQVYSPFLKFKQNEIAALAEFNKRNDEVVVPFFDVPRPQESNQVSILERIRSGLKQIEKNLKDSNFYIDNYDLDDSIYLNGVAQYEYILQAVGHLDVIPVVAFNRHAAHNPAALKFVKNKGGIVALRLTLEDFESYKLCQPDIRDLWKEIAKVEPKEIHLVIDFRVIVSDLNVQKNTAVSFIKSFCNDFNVDKIIITGSSIPAVITTLLGTNNERSIERSEWHLWLGICASLSEAIHEKLIYGDYGFVSPDYSDAELEFWLMQKVAAPKVFYTYATNFFIVRGGAFQTHPDGYRQYFTIADIIVDKPFYRGLHYSYGEQYIYDRSYLAAARVSKGGSPSSWVKAGLSSHITFIVDSL